MKRIYIILLVGLLSITSCTDLDVLPQNAFLAPAILKDAEAYKSYMAKIYGAYSHTGQDGPAGMADISIVNDEGFTSYIRAYWKANELTTDEAVVAWTDAGIRELHEHSWNSDNQFVRTLYYRIFLIIAYSNDFLEQSSQENLELYGVPGDDFAEIERYRLEVRFLRAMAYWHALDFFRNIPLLTKISTELPVQASPKEVYDFIINELNEIEPGMYDPKTNEYGRADKAALWMLRAKVNLNAEVYINESHYDEVIADCKSLIGAGYTLNQDYQTLFMADNHTSDEIIFSLIADGTQAQNWGNTTFLVHAAIGGSMVDTDYGVVAGWAGLRTTKNMVEKFPSPTGNPDSRAIFYTNGQNLEINDIGEFTDGYAVPKYTNLDQNGDAGSNVTHVDTDYPMFRIADAYLMYAEAILRGGSGGDIGEATNLINTLRERAYNNDAGNITASDLTLDFVLDERVRELYWEGTRRIDLIRFGQFSDAGIWPWKGNVPEGRTTESFRDIFPIPASDLVANPRLVQNNGY